MGYEAEFGKVLRQLEYWTGRRKETAHWDTVWPYIRTLANRVAQLNSISSPTYSNATAASASGTSSSWTATDASTASSSWTAEAIHTITTALTSVESRLNSVLGTVGLTAAEENAIIGRSQERVTAEYNAKVKEIYANVSARLPHSGMVQTELDRLARWKESALQDIEREFIVTSIDRTLKADELYMTALQNCEKIRVEISEAYAQRDDQASKSTAELLTQIAIDDAQRDDQASKSTAELLTKVALDNAKMETDVAIQNARGALEASVQYLVALVRWGEAANSAISAAIQTGTDIDMSTLRALETRVQALGNAVSDIVASITNISE